ncbi:hypothetical protein ACPV54_25575 [Vibrio mediterranei]
MSVNFGEVERDFIRLVTESSSFQFNGKHYDVSGAWKPSPSQGECKTDVYILTEQGKEFKISIKKSNADFLENKISSERAQQIFGPDADTIISNSIATISKSFEEHPLICYQRHRRTEEKSIMLGWKFELMNKISGDKSSKLILTEEQKIDVYSGSNLSDDKRNCLVNGRTIAESGVADYLLVIDKVDKSLQFYIDQMIDIPSYVKDQELYFACKALNYRAIPDKWDGDRPLAVHVDWKMVDDELVGEIIYNSPLRVKGNSIGQNVRSILAKLGIDSSNFNELKSYYQGNSH